MEEYCKYIAGCPVYWRDIMIYVGGGCHNSRVAIFSRLGDVQCIRDFNI